MLNPYENLPKWAFWRSGVAQTSPSNLEGIYAKKWKIDSNCRIATAGSCFAQHIARHLVKNGFQVLDLEPPPPGLPKEIHLKFGFSMYSARYGNIYTAHQLLQLAREVAGLFTPQDIAWEKDGKFYDALRPAVEPEGLDSEEEVYIHRKYHLIRVREMFQTMDIFVFTLGLTETWIHRESGTVYPVAPGTIAGTFDEKIYAFKNYEFDEVVTAFNEFQEIVRSLREGNKQPKILLSVSPVPLTATASGDHVLKATMYSKSVLRTVAGQLSANQEHIDYFPSYEIITNQAARAGFFENNFRSVKAEGVETVMRVFFSEHKNESSSKELSDSLSPKATEETSFSSAIESDPQCEELLLEAFGK